MGRTMRFLVLVVGCHIAAVPLSAQEDAREYEVQGVVADSAGTLLQNAMVVALTRPDSVLARYALSRGDGTFTITGLPAGEYILQVTLIGYQTLRRDFDVTNADVDAGEVSLSVTAVEMDELVVSVEHVPFVNRRDTLSYNVQAFPTPPNANVEDLLRRLPGIQVESDGTITAQGETVQNVLVDGRELFSSDATVATQNLPADAVAQVDVYDKQSDMAEFTGIPDGEEERTIDLKLKEEARTGYFGRATGGVGGDVDNQGRIAAPAVGNEARYDGSLTLNRFSPKTQLALTANANNVNRAGFNWRDFADFAGGGGRGGGGNDGFTETMSLGLNASRDFGAGDDTWIRGSYFVSELDNSQDRTLQQQALFGSDIASLVDQTSNQEAGNRNHRLNLNAQVTFSEGHDLRLRMNGNARASSLTSFANRQTHTLSGSMLNSATTDYDVDGDDLGGDTRLTWRRRLNEDGRSLVAELRSGLRDSDLSSDLSSVVTGEVRGRGGRDGEFEEILQEQSRVGRTWSNSARLSLTQPLADGHTMEVFGQRNSTSEDRDNSVHDLVDGVPLFNDRLSSGFERAYTYLQGGARYSRNEDRSWFTVGLRLQRSQLEGVILDRDQTIENGYTHLLANARMKHEIKEGQNLEFRYDGSSREPSLTQLQPYPDNRDPLNVYSGNPDLRPEYRHRFNADYRFFDQFSFINLFTFAGFTYNDNSISTSRLFDERGFQTRMPVNTDGEWSGNLGANFGTPVRRLGIDLDLEYRVTYSEGTELVNLAANESRILRNTFEVSVDNRVKDRFDVEVSADFSFNDVEYSLNQELNRDYVNSQYRAEGTWYLGAWEVETDFRYRTYDQGLFSESRNIARWDASITRRVLDDRAEIELQAYDLLNQNQGVAVTNSANYIQESRTESLGQYFMFRVMYRLGNQMGGRGGRRGGRR
ncbi:MAG: TonB-dependent receptor [Gemmatimonadota bacterium]|nr:TonB-dependent receptor [Gemmatimonadota bacterium]